MFCSGTFQLIIQNIAKTGPGCRSVLKAVDWFQVLSLIFNSSLFLFRVLAVFADFPTIKAGFIILWLSTFLALSIPFSSKLRDVAVCNIDEVHPLEAMGFIAVEVFDTAVFVAVSVQVLRSNITTSGHDRFAAFVTGDKLGQVSRVLLQTGQIYYLWVPTFRQQLPLLIYLSYIRSTIGVNLLALSTLLVPGPWFSPMFKAGMTLVSVTMQNILTCKVVRLLRLGVIPNDPTSISVSIYGTVHFATRSDACQTTSVSASEDEVQRP